MTAVDRYSIKYKNEIKHFHTHLEAVKYVLSLPPTTEKIEIIKYGSWQKELINLVGEINEIQRLVKIVSSWRN
ncbi:MAG TPA: hypothetical protein VMX55_05260 [candidate division Zixibacteria bacterium]|nr:hypothetical protein [candidate division Zixibacteria bacterium]